MVMLDDSKENFIVDIPFVEEVDVQLREEERKKTGRYLALTAVLFLVGLGFYHTTSSAASKMSALISAAMIMFLYLLWMLYAAQRRKHKLKKDAMKVEKQVSNVLEKLNNITNENTSSGPHDNYVYIEDEQETRSFIKNDVTTKNVEAAKDVNDEAISSSSRKSSASSVMFIRTYSIA